MTDLILQLILFSSFAVIVYLIAIAVPRVKDDELNMTGSKRVSILPLDRMDAFLNVGKEKILRRLRIYLLKAEKSVSDQLHKSKDLYNAERKRRSFPSIRSIKRDKITEKSPEETPAETPEEQS